jgi:hypothetical protein
VAAPSWGIPFSNRGITSPTAGGKSAEQGDHFAERGDYLAEQGDHSNVPFFGANVLDGQGRGRPLSAPVMVPLKFPAAAPFGVTSPLGRSMS